MEETKKELVQLYGGKLRVRVCGVCLKDDLILMVRHRSVGVDGVFWSLPGGGMHFGENAVETLQREFQEETGIVVEAGDMLFVNEFVDPPLHAIELFFHVVSFSGSIKTGFDPEFSAGNQILQEARFMSIDEIKRLPDQQVHSIFKNCEKIEDILALKGYFRG